MELIRRDSDYALRTLGYLAKLPKGRRLAINRIASEEGLPSAFLKKIFQRLRKNKLVDSKSGPAGGYNLLKKPSQISMKEILESVQGHIALNGCLIKKNYCSRQNSCKVRKRLFGIQRKIDNLLGETTLGEFIR